MREVNVLISSCAWALRSTTSAVTGKTLGQLIYNKDMIMQVEIDVSWSETLRQKEKLVEKNNK